MRPRNKALHAEVEQVVALKMQIPPSKRIAERYNVHPDHVRQLISAAMKRRKSPGVVVVPQPAKAQGKRKKYVVYSELNPEQKLKANARSHAVTALRRGQLQRAPCEKCGAALAQMHHDDYSKPLQVRWLCVPCHRQWHRENDTTNVMISSDQDGETLT